MRKTAVRIGVSKSTSEIRLTAAEGSRAVDSRAIHPVRSVGSGESTNAPLPGESLFAALTQSLAPLLAETVHDLSNALGSVHLYLNLLELESDNAEKVRQRLREIRPMVEHAESMTRQLLDPVKPDPVKFDPVNLDPVKLDPLKLGNAEKQGGPGKPCDRPARKISLNPVLQRMVPMLSAMLQPGVALHLRLAPDLVAVAIDPTQVVRIVSNLVLNSRDAMCRDGMCPSGEVTIETANWRVACKRRGKPLPKLIPEPGAPAGNPRPTGADGGGGWVLLRVRDTGAGMTNTTRARIFQPFFTTKPSGEGSGLGLSSVLRMVQRSGGTIQVESAPEKGTDITILFPSAAPRNRVDSQNKKTPQHLQPASLPNRDATLPQSELQHSSR